ncbi:peptidoglycan endopeptidase [Propionibacterium freudenreichii]|nr:peptidoglycan endopeptidase [Propionibacterium freudenreichii]MCT2997642.1 peptidoglycan endopeptidase [Propionibacterium freudenreichii]MCT3004737.1 peptidoglycan endopeptidase [Propionibacterium freudenreichii]MCT3010359.1 peptidoglycan endopeptidase [Propionibacterium freudenreichii]MDK9298359.1 C40 family peptidase [Propionibacterium freudenreichii]
MTLPVITVDAVHAAKSSAKPHRGVSLPVAAVALTSALGLGATLLPQTVAAAPDNGAAEARQTASVTRDTARTQLFTSDLATTEVATTSPTIPDTSAQDLNDSFASLGKSTAQKLATDKAAADKAASEQAIAAANAAESVTGKGVKVAPNAATAATSAAQTAINFALAQVGKPYVWGAVGPNAYDCSGLTMAAYKAAGISLPRVTYSQMAAGTAVSQSTMVPGDLIFFYGGEHVGIYLGNGQVVHAADYGTGVIVGTVSSMPVSSVTHIG